MSQAPRPEIGPVDFLGREFLAWAANSDSSELSDERVATTPQVQVLLEIGRNALAAARSRGVPAELELHSLTAWDDATDTFLPNALRISAGGSLPGVGDGETADHFLQRIARDVAPLALIPGIEAFGFSLLTVAVYRHPRHADFQNAVRQDDLLRGMYSDDGSGGPQGVVTRSTGQGGTVQLALLASQVIWATVARLRASRALTPQALVHDVGATLQEIRDAIHGAIQIRALIAFTHIRLPASISTPWGTLREIDEAERRLAPASLAGQLVRREPNQADVVISYSGDVVLDTRVPYRVYVGSSRVKEDLYVTYPELIKRELRCLTALTLGPVTSPPVSRLPTWYAVFDPLAVNPLSSWSEHRHSNDPPPVALSAAQAEAVARISARIAAVNDRPIELALRRLQSALSRRVAWSDRLIDAAIAWENLLGGQTEQRLRLSVALAWLLHPDEPHSRKETQREASALYDVRSSIAHGATDLREDSDLRAKALRLTDFVIDALRALYESRPDLIPNKDRGRLLMLGLSGDASPPAGGSQQSSSSSPMRSESHSTQ